MIIIIIIKNKKKEEYALNVKKYIFHWLFVFSLARKKKMLKNQTFKKAFKGSIRVKLAVILRLSCEVLFP